MRRLLATAASLALLSLGAVGCGGPDPFIGNYTYSSTVATMLTQPVASNTSDTGTGIAVVTASTSGSADYTLDFVGSSSTQHCIVSATRNGDSAMTVVAGQSCMFSGTANNTPYTYTAAITSGNGVVNENNVIFSVNYTISGNVGAIAVVGTGSQVLTATRTSN